MLPAIPEYWNDPVYHQRDPFFAAGVGGQRIGDLYISLARQIPERFVTPYTYRGRAGPRRRPAQGGAVRLRARWDRWIETAVRRVAHRGTRRHATPNRLRELRAMNRDRWWKLQARAAPYLFVSPFAVIFCIFLLYPLSRSLFLSFHKTVGPRHLVFVGLDNYRFLLGHDLLFGLALLNTAAYTVGVPGVANPHVPGIGPAAQQPRGSAFAISSASASFRAISSARSSSA